MAMLDEDGRLLLCDRCGDTFEYDESMHEMCDYIKRDLFWGRPKEHFGDFCHACHKSILPLFHAMRDIDETFIFVNKLKRAINERQRLENNGAATNHVGKRSKGRSERRP